MHCSGLTHASKVHFRSLSALSDSATVNTRVLSIPVTLSAPPSGQCIVPVEIDDASGIAGMDIIIGFDPTILSPVEAKNTCLTAGFLLMMNPSPGVLNISMASNSGIETGKGALLSIIFQVSSKAKEGDSSYLIIENVGLYDENPKPIGVSVSDGMFLVKGQFEQRIPLSTGWNLISFQVMKCFYEKDIPPLPRIDTNAIECLNIDNLAEWLSDDVNSPIRDDADPNNAGDWKRIISFDEKGAHVLDRNLPPFVNTLYYLSFGYGYWIKMNKRGYMIVRGTPATSDTCLNLQSGWNLIGFVLPTICYAENSRLKENICPYKPESDVYRPEEDILYYPLDTMIERVFPCIIDKYRRIVSFDTCSGAMLYDVALPSFINTLYYIGPKYGYWIKIQDPAGARLCFPPNP